MRAVRVADATDGRIPDTQRCFFIVLFTDEKYDKVTLLLSRFSSVKSAKRRKVSLCFFAGERCSTPVSATPTHMLRICVNSPTIAGRRRRRPLQDKIQVQSIDKIKNIHSIPSTRLPYSRPPCTFSGRADNACTNPLGSFV